MLNIDYYSDSFTTNLLLYDNARLRSGCDHEQFSEIAPKTGLDIKISL